MKEKLKKNSGITLIALIITIIVMIILVAVTVNIANENGGLFVRTRQAKVDTAYRAEQENLLMYMYGEDYDAATGKLNLLGVQAKLFNDNNTSNRWESITLNTEFTELTVVGTQSGKAHTILSNGTLDGENDSLQGIVTSTTKDGSVDLDDLINKLNDSNKWTDAKKDGDKVTVTDKETGKEYEISKDGTITEKNNQSSDTNLYEGKVWGTYLAAEKLKELGFTEDEIATREGTSVYCEKVDSSLVSEGNKANNIEEAKQKLGIDTWADNTSIFTFGIKNSKFIFTYNAGDTGEFSTQIDIKEVTKTKIVLNTGEAEIALFVSEDGNVIYYPAYGN